MHTKSFSEATRRVWINLTAANDDDAFASVAPTATSRVRHTSEDTSATASGWDAYEVWRTRIKPSGGGDPLLPR